jgi:hypothetical protein
MAGRLFATLRSRTRFCRSILAIALLVAAGGRARADQPFANQPVVVIPPWMMHERPPTAEEKRSYAPVRTVIHAWDGDRPERAWNIDSLVGFGSDQHVDGAPPEYRENFYTTSLTAAGTFELYRGTTTVWFRVPLVIGSIDPAYDNPQRRRDILVFGDPEVEIARRLHVARDLGLTLSMALSCPTIVNSEALAFGGFQNDSASILRAASAAHGYETAELYETSYFGFTPTVSLLWRSRGLRIEPYVRLMSFLSPLAHPDHRYRGVAIGGVRLSYRFGNRVELALRVWGVFPAIYGAEPYTLAAGPELKVKTRVFWLSVGSVVPLAVESGEARVYGIALGLQFNG